MQRALALRVLLPGLLSVLLLDGCGKTDDRYLPLNNEQTLTYLLNQTRSGEPRRHKLLLRISGPTTVKGHKVYREYTASGPARLLQERTGGIFEIGYYRESEAVMLQQPILLLPQPLQVGDEWQAPVTTHLLEWRKHSLEKGRRPYEKTFLADFRCEALDERIKIPAGTFTNVARVSVRGNQPFEYGGLPQRSVIHVEMTRWYAPGVGLIKSERRESADSRELNPGEATMVLERID